MFSFLETKKPAYMKIGSIWCNMFKVNKGGSGIVHV